MLKHAVQFTVSVINKIKCSELHVDTVFLCILHKVTISDYHSPKTEHSSLQHVRHTALQDAFEKDIVGTKLLRVHICCTSSKSLWTLSALIEMSASSKPRREYTKPVLALLLTSFAELVFPEHKQQSATHGINQKCCRQLAKCSRILQKPLTINDITHSSLEQGQKTISLTATSSAASVWGRIFASL